MGTIQGDLRTPELRVTPTGPRPATTQGTTGPTDGARVTGQAVDQRRNQPPLPTSTNGSKGLLGQQAQMAAQMRGATDPASVVDRELTFRPGAREAFEKLSPQDREKFLKLAREHVPEGGGGPLPGFGGGLGGLIGNGMMGGGVKPGAAPPPKPPSKEEIDKAVRAGQDTGTRMNLYTLLEKGKLTDRDSQGHTLLDNLGSMKGQKTAAGLDGKRVFADTVGDIANPDMIINQGNKGTCTVTTLQHHNASRQPAEYVRLMSGLTSPSGEVKLRNGETLVRDEGLIAEDKSGRSTTGRIYQASMMEYANGSLDYDNATDRHVKPGWRGYVQEGLEKTGLISEKSGLNAAQWEKALDGVMGQDYQARGFGGDRAAAERDLQRAMTQRGGAPVALQWGTEKDGKPGSHALMVEKMDDQYVYLRNPHGNFDSGNKGDVRNEPKRETVSQPLGAPMGLGGMGLGGMLGGAMKPAASGTGGAAPMAPMPEWQGPSGGHIKMTREEFYKNLQFYYVPGQTR